MILSVALAAEPCPPANGADALFSVHPRVAGRMILEVHPRGAPPGWAEAILSMAASRGAPVSVVLGVEDDLRVSAPNAVVLDLAAGVPDQAITDEAEATVRRAIRQVRTKSGQAPRAVYAPLPRRAAEATLALAGAGWILDAKPDMAAVLRPGARYEGTPRSAVIIPSGPYVGCAGSPVVTPISPASLDRAASAVQRAGPTGVARVVLDGASAGPKDATILGRWLDDVVTPAGVRVIVPKDVGSWRKIPPPPATPTVWVSHDDLDAAAAQIVAANPLPHSVAGELSLAAAWLGFATGLDAPDESVPLAPMSGPAADNRSALTGSVSLPRAAVLDAVRAWLGARPDRVPSSFTVGETTLTAGESLVLLASAWRGEDPAVSRPTLVPEPNELGLGFGSSQEPVSRPRK